MNKSQLVSAIATKAELSVTKAEQALAAALDSIVDTLTKGESVSLVGFGSFGVRQRASRKVRNPRTGLEMTVKAAVVPFFKAGKNLKEEVDTEK
ncbi:MAG: HU family DNA-binding protein [Gammaproteobacteria bacterium]|nr:HU family DNA-binding protein [Gammaproteobacteria bacterium]